MQKFNFALTAYVKLNLDVFLFFVEPNFHSVLSGTHNVNLLNVTGVVKIGNEQKSIVLD